MSDQPLPVSVTPETCAGTGVCTFYAANTFQLDDGGKVSIVAGGRDSAADVRNAAEACPTRSIRLGSIPGSSDVDVVESARRPGPQV